MDVLIMIVCATIAIGFLVFIHEGGHYVAARMFGVRVTEFMLGLPGPNIGFTKWGTKFGVTAVPLGGYARVCGMEGGEISPHIKPVLAALYQRGTATMEDIAADCHITDDEAYEALEQLSEWGSCARPGRKDKFNTYRAPEVRPAKQSRASGSGPGNGPDSDQGSASGGGPGNGPGGGPDSKMGNGPGGGASYELGEPRPVEDIDALYESEYAQQYRAQPFWKRTVILLAGIFMNLLFAMLAFVVVYTVIGFDVQNTQTGEITHVNVSPLQSIQAGVTYIGMVCQLVVNLFNPATASEAVSNSTSIVGIAVMSKSFFEAGFVNALFFMATISVSLGIMNLLPIPPLDGGRFVVEVFQKLSRKDVSQRVMGYLSMAGMALFLCLFVVMLNQDIQRILTGFWS